MNKEITKVIILYIGIAVTVLLVLSFIDMKKLNESEYERTNEVVNALVESNVFKYAEYSTSEIKEIDTTTPAKMGNCLYSSEQSELAKKNQIAEPCLFWSQMDSAQFDFHAKTMKARVLASDPVVEAIDKVENGFMQVFDKVINEEYYMRTFQDNYNLIMPPLFTELEDVLRGELR